MYVIFFMILGFVISWEIFLILLRSNLGVVTVGEKLLAGQEDVGRAF